MITDIATKFVTFALPETFRFQSKKNNNFILESKKIYNVNFIVFLIITMKTTCLFKRMVTHRQQNLIV